MNLGLQNELLAQFQQLDPNGQKLVVDFAKSLGANGSRPRGTPGHELLKFAGTISHEDAEQMMQAIEEECERIDPNW
jgi:hypothetical protein